MRIDANCKFIALSAALCIPSIVHSQQIRSKISGLKEDIYSLERSEIMNKVACFLALSVFFSERS